jgi:hypothetical protein
MSPLLIFTVFSGRIGLTFFDPFDKWNIFYIYIFSKFNQPLET